MSIRYRIGREVPMTVIIARLRELAHAVARGDRGELTMRVPAEVDRDADLVMSEAADRLEALSRALPSGVATSRGAPSGRCPGNGGRDVCTHICADTCSVTGAALGPDDGWRCQADSDGECTWSACPQAPGSQHPLAGHHCPLDRGRGDGA